MDWSDVLGTALTLIGIGIVIVIGLTIFGTVSSIIVDFGSTWFGALILLIIAIRILRRLAE